MKSMTGRAALVQTGTAALALPQAAAATPAATAAGLTAYQAQTPTERDAGVLAAHLVDQELTWETCEWPGQLSDVAEMLDQIPGTACATVTVPRDWHNPTDGNTIEIRISKTETAGKDRQGIALVNPGGPSAATSSCQAKPLPMDGGVTYEVAGELGKKGTIKLKMRTPAVEERPSSSTR